jgi:hypothetical protein
MRLLHSLRTRLLLYNSLRMLLLLHLRAPRNSTAIVPIVINRDDPRKINTLDKTC